MPRRENGGWQPSYESVCQGLHFALGVLFTVAPSAVWGRGWVCTMAGFLFTIVFATAKEAGFDTLWPVAWGGEGDSWADSWDDWRHYVLGAYTGLVICLVGVWLK